jgi:6-phosphogluconate dehydrogenase
MIDNNNPQCDIGVIGLAVMGQNLILNINDHGYKVAIYNRTTSKVDNFLNNEAKGTDIVGAHSVEELASNLKSPKRIMLMIKAGEAVDQTIEELLPHLSAGDIVIDGGNSLYSDTDRRQKYLESKGLLYIGTGVSGGEEGARRGPSIMPGGSAAAWPDVKDIFQSIAAKVEDGSPCCDWVGQGGAGHYVKMVHNGIEYGDMQLICEAYQLMRDYLGMGAGEIAEVFAEWNKGDLDSYLVQITSEILAYNDVDGQPLVNKILDAAGQKGTGKWTVISSAELGQPVTLITEAVYARCISSIKEERVIASTTLSGPSAVFQSDKAVFVEQIRLALYASKIVSYTQGYMLMQAAAKDNKWDLNYGGIALMWRGGCIIRSKFLSKIKEAYDASPSLNNLLLAPFFTQAMAEANTAWREVLSAGIRAGIPLPAMGSALAFYDGYRTANLPANLLQAQRDYFGAHTYERIDKPRGEYFHTNWTGRGGDTSSSTYTA